MTAAELFRRGLRDHRRALAAWCAGVAGYVGLVTAIFPSIHGSPEFERLAENYPEVLKSFFGIGEGGGINTGAGYVDIELFSLMLPLLVLVMAVGSGARVFAGEEDAGRLELVLAYPVRRRDAVLWKGATVAAEVLAVSAVAGLALTVLDPIVGLDLRGGRLAAAVIALAVLGILFGWLALAVGAAFGRRTLAIGVPAALGAGGYLVNGLHGLAGWLDPFRVVSPFWLVGSSPLQSGTDGLGLLAVLLLAVLALAAGSLLVERRDLQTP
jgi:ABC-2 type transport system permease protein